MTQQAAVRRVHNLLSHILACEASVRKVQHAAVQVPKEGMDVSIRPPARPNNAWRYHVRVRIDTQKVPREFRFGLQQALDELDHHLKESGLGPMGVEKTPMKDYRFSVFLADTDHANDPFKVLFPATSDQSPDLKATHSAPRLLQWFEKLRKTGHAYSESKDGPTFVMKVTVRTNTAKEKQSFKKVLQELAAHLAEENDGKPAYDQVQYVDHKVEPDRHRLVFHFPNLHRAQPILNMINPHGGYH